MSPAPVEGSNFISLTSKELTASIVARIKDKYPNKHNIGTGVRHPEPDTPVVQMYFASPEEAAEAWQKIYDVLQALSP